MANRNSTAKGDEFEANIFQIISTLLADDEFFVPGKSSKIFRKKSYYSDKRKSNIIFDITIETYLPGANTYSILTIVECKNLAKKVDVSDIEEFSSKVSGIGAHNIKAFMISNSHFQSGTIKYASSQKIGLALLNTSNKLDWVRYRKQKIYIDDQKATQQLIDNVDGSESFIAYVNNKPFTNLIDVLLEYEILDFYNHKEYLIDIPYISDNDLERISLKLLSYDVHINLCIDTEKLCSFISEKYSATFDFNYSPELGALGRIDFDTFKISIANSLTINSHRWRFTLAHEIAHLILHRRFYKGVIGEKIELESSTELPSHGLNQRAEFQANIFARYLLVPRDPLLDLVAKYFVQERITKKSIYWDSQRPNQRLALNLLTKMSDRFNVSKEVAKIRLKDLKLLQGPLANQ